MIAQWRRQSPTPDPATVRAAIERAARAAIAVAECPWTGTVEVSVGGGWYRARWAIIERPGLFTGRVLVMAPRTEERVWEFEWCG